MVGELEIEGARIKHRSSLINSRSGSVSRVLYPLGAGGDHLSGPAVAGRLSRVCGKRPTRRPHGSEEPLAPGPGAACADRLLGLAGGGVCRAGDVAAAAVRSYRTFSPLPVPRRAIGRVFSVALSRRLPSVAVSHHRALSCSDFPPCLARSDAERPPDPLLELTIFY